MLQPSLSRVGTFHDASGQTVVLTVGAPATVAGADDRGVLDARDEEPAGEGDVADGSEGPDDALALVAAEDDDVADDDVDVAAAGVEVLEEADVEELGEGEVLVALGGVESTVVSPEPPHAARASVSAPNDARASERVRAMVSPGVSVLPVGSP